MNKFIRDSTCSYTYVWGRRATQHTYLKNA